MTFLVLSGITEQYLSYTRCFGGQNINFSFFPNVHGMGHDFVYLANIGIVQKLRVVLHFRIA